MDRFKNIMLVINSKIKNPAALSCAFELAMNNNAKLKIVDVVKDTSSYQPILPESAKHLNIHDILVQEKGENLERLVRPYLKEDVALTTRVLTGIPFLEIIREVIKKSHDLVIVTPEGKSELKDMIFGTTTMHLMRKCPCPVWAIKPTSDVPFPRILAAVDPDPETSVSTSLNKMIIEMASSLAELHNSVLHIAHVWDFQVRSVMIPKHVNDGISEEMRTLHKSLFNDFINRHAPDLPEEQLHLIRGEAGSEISRLARGKDIDVIVMGTVSRTGIPGLFIGNTAEKVLYRVNCSVLAVKPDGFTSPVELGD